MALDQTDNKDPRTRLAEIKEEYGIDLRKIVSQLEMLTGYLMESVSTRTVSATTDVIPELNQLLAAIRETKLEISAYSPEEVKSKFIPSATDELDAIVEATAAATNTIMDSAEAIETAANEAAEGVRNGGDTAALAAALQADQANAVMQIFEACSFQDITGQRITKVVNLIQEIEQRIDGLMGGLGGAGIAPSVAADDGSVDAGDGAARPLGEELASGPQLPADAASQEDIDALLASFDAEHA